MSMTNNASGMCSEKIEEFVMAEERVNVRQEIDRLFDMVSHCRIIHCSDACTY